MDQKKQDIINGLLKELQQDEQTVLSKIEKNDQHIQEIDAYLNSLLDKQDFDYQVFSPRKVENVFHQDMEKHRSQKIEYENDNQYQYKQLTILKSRIHRCKQLFNPDEDEQIKIEKNEIKQEEILKKQEAGDGVLIFDILENDRRRIARDLHDSSLQTLAALIHKVELSSLFIDQDPVRAKLELATISGHLKNVIDDIRDTVFNLRPMTFDDLGLRDAINELVSVVKCNYNISIETDLDDIEDENPFVLMTIYRLIQESLNNALKHAAASEIFVLLKKVDNKYHLLISDNGKGFDAKSYMTINRDANNHHYGLSILQERVDLLHGSLTIESKKDTGTKIEIFIPKQTAKLMGGNVTKGTE
ncbi:MAG: sensor histidine kinase [Lachnospiraceae bacterium]|nr:sensor histidine kinase [Lachnospiraceae bacterium]